MSHVSTIKTRITNEQAIRDACKALGMEAIGVGDHAMYSARAKGFGIRLTPNPRELDAKGREELTSRLGGAKPWNYPVVFNLQTGEVSYDNYHGSWGDIALLHRFQQAYTIAHAKILAREQGYSVQERTLEDGSIELEMRKRSKIATAGRAIARTVVKPVKAFGERLRAAIGG